MTEAPGRAICSAAVSGPPRAAEGDTCWRHLEPRWHRVAQEALRIREAPKKPGLYAGPRSRGQDVLDLLRRLRGSAGVC